MIDRAARCHPRDRVLPGRQAVRYSAAMVTVQKILCPVDFSETSRHAFDYALLFAQSIGAELILVHAVEDVPLFATYADPQMDAILQEAEKAARRELAELIADVKAENVRVRSDIIRGRVYKAILQYAEEQEADLIVMGTHGRTGLEYAFFGSVAERVIRRAHCPVLIVPHPGSQEYR